MSNDPEQGPPGHRGVERVTAMLRLLSIHPAGLSLSDLARKSELPLTTAYRVVRALRDADLVRETPDGRQALGVGTVPLAAAFLGGLDLRSSARPALERLSTEIGETCHLGVLASPHVVFVDMISGRHRVGVVTRIGETTPALTTAIGRAILSHSQAQVLSSVIDDSIRMYGEEMKSSGIQEGGCPGSRGT